MRVRLMQRIDFWIGVPLCALLSVLFRIAKFFSQPTSKEPRRALFIEVSEMGSAIIAYSSFLLFQREFNSKDIYFLVFERNRESVELLKVFPPENIIVIKDTSFLRFAFSALRAILKIRALKIDTTIDLELFSRFTSLVSALSGAGNRVGFSNYTAEGLYRGSFLTHPVFYNPHQHMRDNFLSLVLALKENPDSELPLLKANVKEYATELPLFVASELDRGTIRRRLSSLHPNLTEGAKLLVVNPDPGDALPIRGWPIQNFATVIKGLLHQYQDLFVVIVGLKNAQKLARRLVEESESDRCIDFTGKTDTLSELATLLNESAVLLTNDSGPGHIASLTTTHAVVLFGPETPALYSPLGERVSTLYAQYSCSPCVSAHNHRHTLCTNNRCLKAITPDYVKRVVEHRLG